MLQYSFKNYTNKPFPVKENKSFKHLAWKIKYSFSITCTSESGGGIISYLFPTAVVSMFLFTSTSKIVIFLNVFLHTLLPISLIVAIYQLSEYSSLFTESDTYFTITLFTIIPSIIWRQKQPQV